MQDDERIPNGSQASTAYEAIRHSIIEWELRPGEQITELQITQRTGYGRASVRAALTRLAHEQLVAALPRRGYQVAPITFKYVSDVFGVREVIEPAAARQVASRHDARMIAELHEINAACRIQEGPYAGGQYRAANKIFHVTLARATGNERLASITSTIIDDLQRILYLPQVAQSTDRVVATFDEHRRIIEAIERGDRDEAERAALKHVERNKIELINALIATAEIGAINLAHT